MRAMYEQNKTTDDTYPWNKCPYYPTWEPPVNWTWNYPECLLCKLKFYNVEHFNQIKTPEGDLIGYICPTCSDKYEIVIKKKTSSLKE